MDGGAGGFQASARMAEAGELVGRWEVTGGKSRCTIGFLLDRIESANAWAVSDPQNCLSGLLPDVVGWRPAPDGIELASADGRTVVMFDVAGAGRTAGGATLRLARLGTGR